MADSIGRDSNDTILKSWEDIEDYVAFEWTTREKSDLTDSKNNHGCGCLVSVLSIVILALFIFDKYL